MARAALAVLALVALARAEVAPALVWNVSCCRAFEALAAMTVERSGSSLPGDACRAGGGRCADLKLIREFVEQSRAVLGSANVQLDAAALRMTLPGDAEAALELLAWAFLGRVVALPSPGAAGQQKVLLEYEVHSNSLRVKRDSCEFDKSLHSAMVLASVALLVFFISMTVVERARGASATGLSTQSALLAYPGYVSLSAHTAPLAYPAKAGAPLFEALPTKARPRLPWSADGM